MTKFTMNKKTKIKSIQMKQNNNEETNYRMDGNFFFIEEMFPIESQSELLFNGHGIQ